MDTFTLGMIRVAMLETMVALWLAVVGLHALSRRRRMSRTSPATLRDGSGRGPAANAASAPSPIKEAA